ncbi:MBL fold metallo-hydrolase [Gammaproteobacteria bacterium]|nr:MBL fold metallo-hydrolase [Gammaproteobacteria bacterium]
MLRYLFLALLVIPTSVLAKYKNTDGEAIDKSIKDLIRWQRNQKKPILAYIDISNDWRNINLETEDNYLIWIGHSTFLIKKDGLTILTDPVFSDRASPFRRLGPKRLIPPSLNIQDLPPIDIITISHNHYDHLDIRSLKKISKKYPKVVFLIPKGDLDIFDQRNIENVFEFEWWQDIDFKNHTFTFTPVKHWSARGLFDRNESLWGAWFISSRDYSIYHAGDTGYSKDFKETQRRLGSPKYAFIPIGAYDPEWFMSASHVNPEDAIKIMQDLGAKNSYGMHWGTFTLTAEDTLDPPRRLSEAIKKKNIKNFNVLTPGEVIVIEE